MRQKYQDFEEKIKKLELKTNGYVSKEFEVNVVELFREFKAQEIEEDEMYNFIRDEWLNKIIARKQHVKQSKVLAKAEKKK